MPIVSSVRMNIFSSAPKASIPGECLRGFRAHSTLMPPTSVQFMAELTVKTTLIRKGFTLIELMISILVITILIGLLFSALMTAKAKGRLTQARQSVSQLRSSIELYATEDPQKRYPYPGPFADNSNPYGPNANTYIRYQEPTDPTRAWAISYHDESSGVVLAGVLSLLEAKRLPLPMLDLDATDQDKRLLDPWGHPYHYRLSLPNSVRTALTCSHGSTDDLTMSDWNWDEDNHRESLRNGRDATKARPYPYVYSWGPLGSESDSCTWIYTKDER
jgi:prepilin-type N-terminal cleavage/methylation domain-containing protein